MSLQDGQRKSKQRLYNEKFFNNIFSQNDIDFIKLHYKKLTDNEISKKLFIKTTYIKRFRCDFLGLRKINSVHTTISKSDIRNELNSLIKLNYQGIMKESYKKRIKQLENLLNY